jgi:hypothetical protein
MPKNLKFYLKKILRHPFFQDGRLINISGISLVFNFSIWIYLFLTLKSTSESIPLHYNLFFGADYFGSTTEAYFIPLVGLFLLFFNFFLGIFIYPREKIIAYFLISVLPLYQIFLFLAAVSITIINRV